MSFETSKKLDNFLPIAPFLKEENVSTAPIGADKAALIQKTTLDLCRTRGLTETDSVITKILDREGGICTTLETGLSLPHARIGGLSQPCAGLVLIPHGISEPKEPAILIKLMFLFLSPDSQEFFAQHLRILRSAAALLRPPLIDEISNAGSAGAALARLKAAEAGQV